MTWRRIVQEQPRLSSERRRQTGALDEIPKLIEWAEIDRHLAPIYAVTKGGQAYSPLALLKALPLAIWYYLSDVELAEALEDRASFHRLLRRADTGAHRLCALSQRAHRAVSRSLTFRGSDSAAGNWVAVKTVMYP